MARPERFELPTLWFEARCSDPLSYGRVKEQYSKLNQFLAAQARGGRFGSPPRLLDGGGGRTQDLYYKMYYATILFGQSNGFSAHIAA